MCPCLGRPPRSPGDSLSETAPLSPPAKATYAAIAKTYGYLTPDLWKENVFTMSPIQEFTDYLMKNHRQVQTQQREEGQ